jgi:ribosomal protein S20
MPQTKSAKKALRNSKRRAVVNLKVRKNTKTILLAAKKKPTVESVRKASSALDQAAKKNLLPKQRASRLKKRLNLLLTKSGKVGYTNSNQHAQKSNKPATARRLRKTAAR